VLAQNGRKDISLHSPHELTKNERNIISPGCLKSRIGRGLGSESLFVEINLVLERHRHGDVVIEIKLECLEHVNTSKPEVLRLQNETRTSGNEAENYSWG